MFLAALCCVVFMSTYGYDETYVHYKKHPAPDQHRCGLCPTYYNKICAFDFKTNSSFIFDNHCIMDLYNCIHGADFESMNYEECLYFGNFAYVHGHKFENTDYDEVNIKVFGAKKNVDFV